MNKITRFPIKSLMVVSVLLACSENDQFTGGASETEAGFEVAEAGFEVAVVDQKGQAAPQAKVWVYPRLEISEPIDSATCNQEGICHFESLNDGRYLIWSEYNHLMAMSDLTISNTPNKTSNDSQFVNLQLAPSTQITIDQANYRSNDSLIRIGIAGQKQWDTLMVGDLWQSNHIPQGEHILIIEAISPSGIIESSDNFSIVLDTNPTILDNLNEVFPPPQHILFDDFYDRQGFSDWSERNELFAHLWEYQGEVVIGGQSKSYVPIDTNGLISFFNMFANEVQWNNILDFYVDLDTNLAGGLIIPADLDSTLLPDHKPYLDFVTEFYSTPMESFTHVDSVSLVLRTQGLDDFQVVLLNESNQVVDETNLIGTQDKYLFTTLKFQGVQAEFRKIAFRFFGMNNRIGYIVIHTH